MDIPPIKGTTPEGEVVEIHPDPNGPLAALAFKIMADPYVGRLTFIRVYSGTLTSGSYVYNTTKGRKERVARLLRMHANHREEVEELKAGDLGAVVGLKETITGDTLVGEDAPRVILESIEVPEPVIDVAIEPKTKADQEKLSQALARLAEEDPHLPRLHPPRDRPDHHQWDGRAPPGDHRGPAQAGVQGGRQRGQAPGGVPGDHHQAGGRGGQVHPPDRRPRPVRPREDQGGAPPRGSGFEFVNAIVGGVIPKEYIPAVQKGIEEAMQSGPLIGFPVVDIKVTLYDGSYHEVDSSEMAFKIAGSMAIKEAVQKGDPVILEPIMRVEVTTPEEYMGDVIGDLNARRGQILGMEPRGNAQVIRAFVPLAEMFGYATDLRSKTQGRGSFVMFFDHYQEVPKQVQEKLIKGQ